MLMSQLGACLEWHKARTRARARAQSFAQTRGGMCGSVDVAEGNQIVQFLGRASVLSIHFPTRWGEVYLSVYKPRPKLLITADPNSLRGDIFSFPRPSLPVLGVKIADSLNRSQCPAFGGVNASAPLNVKPI